MNKIILVLSICLSFYCFSHTYSNILTTSTNSTQIIAAANKLPLFFVENRGQVDTSLQFYSYGGQMYFSPEGIYTHIIQRDSNAPKMNRRKSFSRNVLSKETASIHENHLVLKKRFLNANTHCEITGEQELPGKINYFIGKDSTQWHINLRTFKKIRYKNLYPDIDLVYHGDQGPTEYDLVVNPEAHNSVSTPLSQIQFTIDGADKLELSPEGDLLVHTPMGILKEKAPVSYQIINGAKQTLSSQFILSSNKAFSFKIPQYDTSQKLVIDPLIYSTFLGVDNWLESCVITLDSTGNAIVAGNTSSPLFPITPGTFDTTYNDNTSAGKRENGDIFITKINASGSGLIFSTFLGGDYIDSCSDISVDSSGNIYICGDTFSTSFPISTGAFDSTLQYIFTYEPTIFSDGFVAKLNSNGSALIYSTYLGVDDNIDECHAIAVDSIGNAYVTGEGGIDFPVTNGAFDTTFSYFSDIFITKLNTTGSALIYSTHFGGKDSIQTSNDITVDDMGNAYLVGFTWSTTFPTTPGAYDSTYNGGIYDSDNYNNLGDCFVSKLNPDGSTLVYSTYLGGSKSDEAIKIRVDKAGCAYISGNTLSADFPTTAGAYDTTYNGGYDSDPEEEDDGDDIGDCFITKMNPTGSNLIYSTFLGGNKGDGCTIAIDSEGNTYICGDTNSSDFPITKGAYDPNYYSLYRKCFVSKLNTAGNHLLYSTYLGGYCGDGCFDLAIDKEGNAYLSGLSYSNDYPTTPEAFDQTFDGEKSPYFVTKISLIPELPSIKVLLGKSISNVFDMDDYNTPGDDYSISSNFLNLESLSSNSITQAAYDKATVGNNLYLISNSYGASTATNKVKYSTYRLNKLPWVGLSAGDKVSLNLSGYCYTTTGRVTPPSFGSSSALVICDTTIINAKWSNSSCLEITALSNFGNDLWSKKGWIDVIASPVTSHCGMDIDRERINIYSNLLNIGKFTTFNDIWNYGLEKTTDKSSYPAISFLTTANDGSGSSQSNVMCFDFTSTNQGIKLTPQFSSMINYEANKWYVARMKVCSPTVNNDLQSQLYHYNGVIPDNAHIDISANIYFGTPTTWSWIETPLYSTTTGTGYPQIMLKAGTKIGKINLAEVQVIEAIPTLYKSTRSKHTLDYAYSNFSSLSYLAMGWSTTECFDNGTSKPALSVSNPGVLTVNFAKAPSDGKSMKFTAWNGNTQKILTPANTPGTEIGMKADINVVSGSFDSYNAMVFLGCYGVATNGSYDFYSMGGQLAAMAEFGTITNGTHYLAAPGRNGYHQLQFVLKNNENGVLSIQNVDFLRDTDDPYFGNPDLFP